MITKEQASNFQAIKVFNFSERFFTADEYQRVLMACKLWYRRVVIQVN